MQTEIIKVTPSMARMWLEKNHMRQRNVLPTHVNHLAQQMAAGQWQLNGEPVIFDEDGNVIDGQHRLYAIIQSGTEQMMLVVSGIESRAFLTINTGRSRTAANVLAINGIKNFSLIATVVTGVWNYRRALTTNEGKGGSLNSTARPSRQDVLEEYEKNAEDYQHAAHLAMKCKHLVGPGPTAIVAALAIIDGSQDTEVVNMFFDLISTGINIEHNSPVYRLRERLIKNKGGMSKLSQHHLVLLTARAWNLFACEKTCGVLRLDSDNAFKIN
jgi:hypothetical protein